MDFSGEVIEQGLPIRESDGRDTQRASVLHIVGVFEVMVVDEVD